MQIEKVIKGDFCIGCGVCAVVSNDIKIKLNSLGQYQAELLDNISTEIDEICPFTNESKNEDELSDIFLDKINDSRKNIGKYLSNYVGFVKNSKQRETSSSGGILSWLLIRLLENKEIDGVIHVGNFENDQNVLMGYRISLTKEDVLNNRKSRYYPIEMSNVLTEIKKEHPLKKFAIIGIPCFIKSIRLLQLKDSYYKENIKYTFGIVCGHLKSKYFAESYALEAGLKPNDMNSIDFRYYQDTDTIASNYSVKIEGKEKEESKVIIKGNNDFYASNWGHGMFKYNACEFCDDVLAETADIVFGDAWLPEYVNEPKGTNIITVRNIDLNQLLKEHNDELWLEILDVDKILLSQDAGIRHRTEGLQYRLSKNKTKWIPKKRLDSNFNHLDKKRKSIYDIRTKISKESNQYFSELKENNDFKEFKKKMDPLLEKYNELYFPNKVKKIKFLFLKRIYWKLTDNVFKNEK